MDENDGKNERKDEHGHNDNKYDHTDQAGTIYGAGKNGNNDTNLACNTKS